MSVQRARLAYVTGSSRGIGEALVHLLIDKGFHVIGLSRSNSFEHEHFSFLKTDLSNIDSVKNLEFTVESEQVLLVNNAGLIGQIDPVGDLEDDSIEKVINVNTIAPQILTNKFIKRFKNVKGSFHILNISSGAGKKAIDAWATYCASKAALDLFSETVAEELEWRGHHNWAIHSCAPGVVDTKMQTDIRSASAESFKLLENFKDLKANNELYTPKYVAHKLFEVIDNPKKFPEVLISVRDF